MTKSHYQKGFANVIFALVIGALAVVAGAFIDHKVSQTAPMAPQASGPVLAGGINYPTGGGTYRLASSISSTQTTIKLSSFKEPTSNIPYTMSYLNASQEYATIDAQTTISEFVSFTGITQNTDGTAVLTGVTRGLSRSFPYTASTTFQTAHSAQSTLVLSNPPQLYNDIYTYIQNATYAGTVDMTTSVKGIAQRATGAQAAAHAADGSGGTTAPLVLSASIASSTRTANTAQVVVASSTDGYIDLSYIDTTKILRSPDLTGTTTMATSTSFFKNGIALMAIGKNFQVTTNTGTSTFTVPSGVNRILVTICAGGGTSPGQASNIVGATGGAGGCGIKSVDVTGTSSVIYYVGSASTWSTFGVNGFYFSCSPGANAVGGGSQDGGTGGTCTGADLNIHGGRGSPDLGVSGLVSGGNQQAGASYFGGDGAWGSGTNQGVAIFNW